MDYYGFRDEEDGTLLIKEAEAEAAAIEQEVAELAEIIRDENISMLKSIKGIGPKAANRIVVELKDKISLDMSVAGDKPAGAGGASMSSAQKEIANEAIAALTMLGFSPAPSQKAVHQIIKATPDIAVEQIIKQALKML